MKYIFPDRIWAILTENSLILPVSDFNFWSGCRILLIIEWRRITDSNTDMRGTDWLNALFSSYQVCHYYDKTPVSSSKVLEIKSKWYVYDSGSWNNIFFIMQKHTYKFIFAIRQAEIFLFAGFPETNVQSITRTSCLYYWVFEVLAIVLGCLEDLEDALVLYDNYTQNTR